MAEEGETERAETEGTAESESGTAQAEAGTAQAEERVAKRPTVDPDAKVKRRVNLVVLLVGLLLVAAVAAGVFFSLRFVEDERARDLQAWQIRLGIVADGRVAAVNDWVEGNYAVLRELAENASLQLYMTELEMAEGDMAEVTDADAQASYLRTLLTATAERTGFKPPIEAEEVAANVERVGVAGIGLVDAQARPLASSPGMPPVAGRIKAAVDKALKGEPALIDAYMGASNLPTVGFVLPIFGLQDDGVAGIGAVVGVRILDRDLFRRLSQPGETEESAETYLVRKKGGTIEYLSPLADGTPPLTRTIAADTPDLVAAFGVANPGGFSIGRDYAGDEALVTARPLAAVPWTLVRKVSRAEALSETETRLKTILIVFGLIIGGVTVAILAVWKHGSSLRAARAAAQYQQAAEKFESILQFSRTLTDSQPTHIVCVTPKGEITFANRPFADHYGIPITDIRFKPLAAVIGPARAHAMEEANKRVIETPGHKESHVHKFEAADDPGGIEVLVSDHVHIPADATHPPAALMVIHDISELSRERERGEMIMRRLTDTLVSVVDRRDPYSANHSARVAEVARSVAEEMGLEEEVARTVDVAGSLMNLGKIFIPSELLTKTGNLTPAEREQIANTHVTSAELLDNVPFDGPVVDSIRQMGETWDGSGPLGLVGEDTLPSARILAVANAFVGMISPRAYRDAMTFEKVSNILLQDSGTRYDRKPVSALINYLENRNGIERWAHFRETPKGADAPQETRETAETPPSAPEPDAPDAVLGAPEDPTSPLGRIRARLTQMAEGSTPLGAPQAPPEGDEKA